LGPIEEKVLTGWDEFDNIICRRAHRAYVYRGHSNSSFKLESSLFRAFEEVLAITKLTRTPGKAINKNGHEKLTLNKFIANAHLFLPHTPKGDDALSWMSIMQHFGAPTRMLDFTFSPYVATYFALESGTEDSAIYSLKHSVLKEIDSDYYKDIDVAEMYKNLLSKEDTENHDEEFLYVYEPHYSNQRLMAQQGLFVIPSTNQISHEAIIAFYRLKQAEMVKYVIPKEMRKEGLKRLQKMNITATMLFPGLEGFCKSFKYQSLFPLSMQERLGEL
jgi:hypothetical protein